MKLNSIFTNKNDQIVIDPFFLIKKILKQKTFLLKFTALFSLIALIYAFAKKPYYKSMQTFIFEEKYYFLRDEVLHIKNISKNFWNISNIIKFDISIPINSNRAKPIAYFAESPEIHSNPLYNKIIFVNKAFTKEIVEQDSKLIRNEFEKYIYFSFDKKEKEIIGIKELSKKNLNKSIIKINKFLNTKGIVENVDLKYLDKIRYELNLKVLDNINNGRTRIENINKKIFRQNKFPKFSSEELVEYNLLKNELDSHVIENYVTVKKYIEFLKYKQKIILDFYSNEEMIINKVSINKLQIILSYTFVGLIISSLIVFFREVKKDPDLLYK